MRLIAVLLVTGFALAGCSSSGPCNITPVTGVCKSCKPYFARGSWHYPQRHYEYDQTGLASWYGPRFHGKQKANGERFNQNEISAAHTTLPLPSVVKVTNLETGSYINLIIDDRGPYVYKGRIIDLSVGAAKRLGVYHKGIAQVRIQTLVAESKALSDYLARRNIKSDNRTWATVYRESIQGATLLPPVQGPVSVAGTRRMVRTISKAKILSKAMRRVNNDHEEDLQRLITQLQ